jgi:hypothetical protein
MVRRELAREIVLEEQMAKRGFLVRVKRCRWRC